MISFANGTKVESIPGLSTYQSNGTPQPRPRAALAEAFAKQQAKQKRQRPVHAGYDAARDGDEYKKLWDNTDAFDADSAHSVDVRRKLVHRSRYEVANNGYSAGIASTYANDLVASGPTLRMQTGSEGFNRMVERAWNTWAKKVHLRRKLWTMGHAKYVDGEAFAVVRQNRKLRHPVKIDVCLYETDQFHTPYLPFGTPNHIDGIEFDDFGNPVFYDLLRYHPGANREFTYNAVPERIPAQYVMHWFKMNRPGQHRQVPECASTLNLGAASRRWREAVLAAADNIANFSLFLKTTLDPDVLDLAEPMSTMEILKGMMTALPGGYDAFQPRAEQPTANHHEFNNSMINEQARPVSMPRNKAACDSSDYNFASGRLDHSTYYGSLDIQREDCNDLVLDPLFELWFEYAVVTYGWLGGNPEVIENLTDAHLWDWPKHQVADEKSHAQATQTKLATGQAMLHEVYAADGKDFNDALIAEAEYTGVPVNVLKTLYLIRNVPQASPPYIASELGLTAVTTGSTQSPTDSEADDAEED